MALSAVGPAIEVLTRAFFQRPTVVVARELIGHTLVRGQRRLRIVETEAYVGPEDLASHAAKGRRTARNEAMYGPAGHAYIYLIYGVHHCLNVVTEGTDFPAAVLIRAAEPGARGPGVLCRELAITREQNGLDLTNPTSVLRFEVGAGPPPDVVESARIGVAYAGEWAARPWRFALNRNPWVSRPAPWPPSPRRRGGALL